MPEFEIYPSNLRRHKKKYKQRKVIEQNSPMFALKLEPSLASKENLQKHLQSSLKAYRSRNTLKVSFGCYKSRGPTVISHWSKIDSCVLYRSYPRQLRSSRGQAIWKSVAKNLDFFWLLIEDGVLRTQLGL